MVSINTNLSSLIVRNNLTKSTNGLNQAIERMTTGFKLNHASDNAANYSISQDMNSQLSSYDVATDNISMGNDLVSTAQDSISLMQTHAERIHNLVTQAMNGTYGEQSQQAIVSEINARIAEIDRLYETTEYNGIQLLNDVTDDLNENMPKAGANGFIDDTASQVDYTDDEIAGMTSVSSVTGNYTSGMEYKISSVAELQKLATDVNAGKTHTGAIFVLADDLDLSEVENFTPIGTSTSSKQFKGIFNGNGNTISNLTINKTTSNTGLFGYASSATIKNVNLENVNITAKNYVGGLVGQALNNTEISNCSASGVVYATEGSVGGLVGKQTSGTITNCFTDVNVSTTSDCSGGLVGSADGSVQDCYAIGNVTGKANTGGLTGCALNMQITNSFAAGDVYGSSSNVGGLIGLQRGDLNIDTCYSSGSVYGKTSSVGGLVGRVGADEKLDGNAEISNCISYSTVYSSYSKGMAGSFIGAFRDKTVYPPDYPSSHGDSFEYTGTLTVTNCKSIDNKGLDMISGAYDYIYNSDGTKGYVKNETYDLNPILSEISTTDTPSNEINLQVGINGGVSDLIKIGTSFAYSLSHIVVNGKVSKCAYNIINDFMDTLSAKTTELGAVSNRLDSALESTSVAMENLTSSLSTIRDADIAKESSSYIKAQILQQASATLLATANQTPSIALQLI